MTFDGVGLNKRSFFFFFSVYTSRPHCDCQQYWDLETATSDSLVTLTETGPSSEPSWRRIVTLCLNPGGRTPMRQKIPESYRMKVGFLSLFVSNLLTCLPNYRTITGRIEDGCKTTGFEPEYQGETMGSVSFLSSRHTSPSSFRFP